MRSQALYYEPVISQRLRDWEIEAEESNLDPRPGDFVRPCPRIKGAGDVASCRHPGTILSAETATTTKTNKQNKK